MNACVIDGLDPNTSIAEIQHLSRAIDLVHQVMESNDWLTLFEVQAKVQALPTGRFFSETCISARIRDLRKDKHGAHTVDRRKRAGTRNLYEYKLISNSPNPMSEAA